jgi:hypothetical protein
LPTVPTENGFVMWNPHPGNSIGGCPHGGVIRERVNALIFGVWVTVTSDRHQTGPTCGHAEHVLLFVPAKDSFVVRHPRPRESIG